MPRRKRRYYNNKADKLLETGLFLLFLSAVGIYLKYKDFIIKNQAYIYATIWTIITLFALLIIFLYRKKGEKIIEYENDDKIIYMLRGMPPAEFEKKVADMFSGLGYKTKVIGGPHDGGIDIIAEKNGEEYPIQCKKYITSEVSVHEVRDFYGAISARLAKKGFFITANKFTLDAEKFAEGNSKIELVDAEKLIKYYKLSFKKSEENINDNIIETKINYKNCPLCGGSLILRTAKKGNYAGKNFYGCSNYPKCKFIKNA